MNHIIETDRLILRVLSEEDALLATRFYQDNWFFLSQWEPNVTIEFAEELFHRNVLSYEAEQRQLGKHFRYWYGPKEDLDRLYGSICFQDITSRPIRSCQIGYKQDRLHLGQGYATEAASAALEHLFRDCGFQRVEAIVEPHNQASVRLLERLGFHMEALVPNHVYLRGDWQDCQRWSRDIWQPE